MLLDDILRKRAKYNFAHEYDAMLNMLNQI